MDEWRQYLYLPLGLLPSLFFTARFLLQWLASEKEGQSIVRPLFWRLSICGNLLLMTHFFIQLQYPFCLIQAGNAVISWRNLNLMQSKQSVSTKRALICFVLVLLLVTSGFFYQRWLWRDEFLWLRIPSKYQFASGLLFWQSLGILGETLFASRFWVQWYCAEKSRKSYLGKEFWCLSIMGSLLSLGYFINTLDLVGAMNHFFGLVPYVRNLMLLQKTTHPKTF